jgi:hypothetical protein
MYLPTGVQTYSMETGGTLSFPTRHHAASDGTFDPDVSGWQQRSYDKPTPSTPQSIHIYIYVPLLDFFQICKGATAPSRSPLLHRFAAAVDMLSITRAAG